MLSSEAFDSYVVATRHLCARGRFVALVHAEGKPITCRVPETPAKSSLNNRVGDRVGSQYHCAPVYGDHGRCLVLDVAHRSMRGKLFSVPIPRRIARLFAPLKDLNCATFCAIAIVVESLDSATVDWLFKTPFKLGSDCPLTRELQNIVRLVYSTSENFLPGPFIDVATFQKPLNDFRDKQGSHDNQVGQDLLDILEVSASVLHLEALVISEAMGIGRCSMPTDGMHDGKYDSFCPGEQFTILVGVRGSCCFRGCSRRVFPGLLGADNTWRAFVGDAREHCMLAPLQLPPQLPTSPDVLLLSSARSMQLHITLVDGRLHYSLVRLL